MTIGPVFITVQESRQPGPFGAPLVDVRPAAHGMWYGWYRGTDVRPTIYDPGLWAPVRRFGMTVDLRPRARGAGDLVARATQAMGVRPCEPCKRRQQTLNRWFPFS